MLRFLKYTLATLALFFTLSIVALIVVLNIDPNNHKDWIENRFEQETGRQLALEGDIALTVYPWLGISIEGLSISDDPAFSRETAFFSTERASFRIRLLPLMKGEIEIDTVILHDTWLRLTVNETGRGNWESLSPEADSPQSGTTSDAAGPPEIPRIVIGGVDIQNLNLVYEDRVSDNRYSIDGLQLSIPALTLGESIPVDLQTAITIADPDLEIDVMLDAVIDYAEDGMAWTLGPLNLQTDLRGPTVPGGSATARLAARASVDLREQTLSLPELSVDAFGTELRANARGEQLDSNQARFSGQLNIDSDDLGRLLGVFDDSGLAERISAMDDPGLHVETRFSIAPAIASLEVPVLNARILGLRLDGSAASTGSPDSTGYDGTLQLSGFSPRDYLEQLGFTLPETRDDSVLEQVSMDARFSGNETAFSIDTLNLILDDTRINGQMDYGLADSSIDFQVNIDTLDLDRYLPPGEAPDPAPEDGTAEGALPLETLRDLRVNGRLDITYLRVSGLTLQETGVDVSARDGVITLSPSSQLYDGTYSGELALDAREPTPAIRIDSDLSGVNLGNLTRDFLQADYLRGMGDVSFSLQGRGLDSDALRNSLNGSGRIDLQQGRLYGVDIAGVLQQVETMIRERRRIEVTRGEYTAFDSFSSSFAVDDGVITTDDLLMSAPGFRVQGAGTLLNLRDETFNFNLLAAVNPDTAGSEQQRFDLAGNSIPITCQGSISSPRCLPDLQQIIQSAVGRELERRVGDLLQRALGGEEESGDSTNGQNLQEEESGEDNPLNRVLDRLFQ